MIDVIKDMKKILFFLILGLLLSVNLKADDITEFQIEGISVGETLLNFMSIKEIKKANPKIQVYIRADKSVTYAILMKVMKQIIDIGILNVNLITLPKK